MGYGNYVPSFWNNNVVLGSYDTAQASNTVVLGTNNAAYGANSTVTGYYSKTYGQYSLAAGYSDESYGQSSIALGEHDTATGTASIALGIHNSATGAYSTAMGSYVSTQGHAGSFIYGDNSTTTTETKNTADNQFMVRAAGGTIIYSNAALSAGVTLTTGNGAWASVSDRNKKENFSAVDKEDVLNKIGNMEVSQWNYKAQPVSQHHIGPMAQDFYAAFNLDGQSDTTINTLDIDGINMAGIQALKKRTDELKEKVAEVETLRKEIEALKNENAQLHTYNTATNTRIGKLESSIADLLQRMNQTTTNK